MLFIMSLNELIDAFKIYSVKNTTCDFKDKVVEYIESAETDELLDKVMEYYKQYDMYLFTRIKAAFNKETLPEMNIDKDLLDAKNLSDLHHELCSAVSFEDEIDKDAVDKIIKELIRITQ